MLVFSIASRYLIPKKGQLSVSFIALMSVGVISLVTWLLLVFLSITEGIETSWIQRLTALNAPVRITPTQEYFNSYYYQVDALSYESDFTLQTIGQKAIKEKSDPFNPLYDRSLPAHFPKKELDSNGNLLDPVKIAYSILQTERDLPKLQFQDFLVSGSLLRLQMVRPGTGQSSMENKQSFLTQVSYLASFSDKSPSIKSLLLKPRSEDLGHLLYLTQFSSEEISSDNPDMTIQLPFQEQKKRFADLKTAIGVNEKNEYIALTDPNSQQKTPWITATGQLPGDFEGASSIVLPKSFQDYGALIGDRGYLSYPAATASSVQELRLPVYVAGFYDPGVMHIGNRCILVPDKVVAAIDSANKGYSFDKALTNGIHVWFSDLKKSDEVKKQLQKAFKEAGIDRYWKIETFREYDFAKPLFNQFQSDKLLFSLVGAIILLVASCNIVSLLVLLVNDKKREIGILLALGASRRTIGMIFGVCGLFLGVISCLLGAFAAYLTMHNIDAIVKFLGYIQGHTAFNPDFFGNSLPNTLSSSALLFIAFASPFIALLAGVVPAVKASALRPSDILRSQ